MNFDFPNYTYSGLLSLVSALFSIAYPQILSSIEKVDTKYNSTLLSSRLKRENAVFCFRLFLLINITISVLNPFLMYGSEYTYIYIIIQGVFTVALIASTFCLFHTISIYGDSVSLHQIIWDKFKSEFHSDRKKQAEQNFNEWIDLSKTILTSSDQRAARKVYEGWHEYIAEFYRRHKSDGVDYDQFFYDGLTRLNETLCQMPAVPISINNGNDIMTSLILLDKRVSSATYVLLWKNLRIQLFYGKEDWIMEYWTQASQKFQLFMRPISEYERNVDEGRNYSQDEVKMRDKDRWSFLRFHIMLCAMIMNVGKYSLLSRMLSFTQSTPLKYPLVPSDISSIFSVFNDLNKSDIYDPFGLASKFPMPGMNGISDGKILGAANEFLSLLIFRIYTLNFPYGASSVMQTPYLNKNLNELRENKDSMETLQRWIKKTKENKELLEIVGIKDWDSTLSQAKDTYREDVDDPETIIDNFLKDIDKTARRSRQELPYDIGKVKSLKNSITGFIIKGFKSYGIFLGDRKFENAVKYLISGSLYDLYPNNAFVKNSDIAYVDIDESVSYQILNNFKYFFGNTFAQAASLNNAPTYTIDSEDVFKCIDRLQLDDKHIIISFGMYWDFYLDRQSGFEKNDDSNYKYKNVEILNLAVNSSLVSRHFFVLNKDDIPYFIFKQPNDESIEKYSFEKYDGLYGLWLSLQKIVEHPDLISEAERGEMTEDPNELSLLSAYLEAECHWKNNISMVKVKVLQKLVDNGNFEDVSNVKPFPKE